MKKGQLSSYFNKIVLKRLSSVEINNGVSNQHEINGGKELIDLFGNAGNDKKKIFTNFMYISDDPGDYESTTGYITWYDARVNNKNRTEHRLYYPNNDVTNKAKEGDILMIGEKTNQDILYLVIENKSTILNQVFWLFNVDNITENFQFNSVIYNDKKIDFASKFILEELGLQVHDTNENFLEIMKNKFGNNFPPTKEFSNFARETLTNISLNDNPDKVILEWMNQEEMLFKTFEKYIISNKLKSSDENIFDSEGIMNVDFFIKFSLSIQNTRKSRVGQALENHLEELFKRNGLSFSRGKITENKSKPDFIFPEINYYNKIDERLLTMLGSKSTCKDRWRQVLSEAKKIKNKHLFTLEPSISENQTNEMISNKLQLVIPREIFQTYSAKQQSWLIDLDTFIKLVKTKEEEIFY